MENTLVVQYQLVQGSLNYVYMIKKEKIRMEKGTLQKTNYGPLTRLTLFYIVLSFIKTETRTHARPHTRTQVNIEQDNIF